MSESDYFSGALVRLDKKGEGCYGIVYKATDVGATSTYAVKRNLIDTTSDFIGSLRELDILAYLNGHPHIIRANSIHFGDPFKKEEGQAFSPLMDQQYKDDRVHFIFEEADMDAAKYFPEASWAQLKTCMVHLLLAVEYCHAKGIIHRDLKPSNLLIFLGETPTLKVCDFGLSKPITFQGYQTPSIVTSWYRAPEILNEEGYDHKVDLWSVGCIFYEMVTKIPLLYGSPDRDVDIKTNLKALFPELNLKVGKEVSLGRRKKANWRARLNRYLGTDEMRKAGWEEDRFLDLLEQLLCCAESRIDATQALDHDFFVPEREYISSIREAYPPIPDEELPLKICPCLERTMMGKIAENIFQQRNSFHWYSHRILFQAISLFDRYLAWPQREPNLKKKVRLAFITCIYLAMKYFTSLQVICPFSVLYGEISDESKRWAETFEETLIEKVSDYHIYRPTMYEAADTLDEILEEHHVRELLNIYLNGVVTIRGTDKTISLDGLTPTQVYLYYRGKVIS
jgi:serine/threonine protein kinase